jgi:uncharacterized protein YndB with AHSA1/START domain
MTMQTAPTATVKRTLRVGAPIEHAFRVLTEKMSSWWPATHHIAKRPFAEIVVEPRIEGRWFERDASGAECDWGRVLVYEPPKRLVVSWHLQTDWSFDPNPGRASEVSFEFIEEGPEQTRLEFAHRYLERHGEDWEKVRAAVDSPGGWSGVLAPYVQLVGAKPSPAGPISKEEREFALVDLAASHRVFLEAARGLSTVQWTFQRETDGWSPAQCAEHIAIVEDAVLQRVFPKALSEPADPAKRNTLKYSDVAVQRLGKDRANKLNAPERVRPSGRFGSPDEIVRKVAEIRGRMKDFVESTQDDLRNHFADHPLFGTLDLYQWVLLASVHMVRHSEQLNEVKRDPRFPKA